MTHLQVRLEDEDHAALARHARERGLSLQALARSALRDTAGIPVDEQMRSSPGEERFVDLARQFYRAFRTKRSVVKVIEDAMRYQLQAAMAAMDNP